MTLGRIWNHEIAYAVYAPFVKICGRDLFNPTDDTYLTLGFEILPELEPLEGYHTAWRVDTRPVPLEPTPELTPDLEPQYEEYIEAYYEEDPEPEDPEEIARRQEAERRAYWYREFFQTSLGWVRKKATMKDGSIDNFITDDLPLLEMGLRNGFVAKVIVYATPDFTHDIDILALQSYVPVTPQFIGECLQEKQNEFRSLTI